MLKKFLMFMAVMSFPALCHAYGPLNVDAYGSQIGVPVSAVQISSAGSTGTGGGGISTATVVAASLGGGVNQTGTNLFNYISHIHIEMYAKATLTGGVTQTICTSDNLPGTPTWNFPSALAAGAMYVVDEDFSNPIKSTTAGQATLVKCPATANVIWNVAVNYFQDN